MPTLQSEFLYHGVHRLSYGWQNPNFAAAVIVCLLPLIWVLTDLKTQKGGGGVYLTWLAEILLGLMLVWTFSRGAVLAWAVSVVVYGLVFPRLGDNGPKPSVSRQHLLLRLIILGIAASSNGVLGRFASVAEGDASAVNRLELWSGGLSMLRYAPLTGWGSGNSGLAFMQWFQNPASTFGVGGMVNSYLWFAVEHGLPALFLALLAFVMPCSLGFLQTEIQSGAGQLLLKGDRMLMPTSRRTQTARIGSRWGTTCWARCPIVGQLAELAPARPSRAPRTTAPNVHNFSGVGLARGGSICIHQTLLLVSFVTTLVSLRPCDCPCFSRASAAGGRCFCGPG